jgi:outer membrane protein assembly factor BamD (BamD/ComL family)
MNFRNLSVLLFLALFSCSTSDKKEEIEKKPSKEELTGSQTELNSQEIDKATYSREVLDSVYNAVILEYKDQLTFISNFKKSQKLWERYMEAQLLARFPEDDATRDGSCFSMCYSLYQQELFKERIKTINEWLTGFPQGQICGGSVKVKE